MEKFLFILITLLFTIDVQAQEEYSYNQLIAAMKCRMIKMEAVMDVKESSETFNDTDTPVRLTLVYGAQSSGYASDDYVYLMYETPDGTECKDCKGFMDYPTTKLTGKPIDGAEPYLSVFYGKNQVLSIGNIKPAPTQSQTLQNLIIIFRLSTNHPAMLLHIIYAVVTSTTSPAAKRDSYSKATVRGNTTTSTITFSEYSPTTCANTMSSCGRPSHTYSMATIRSRHAYIQCGADMS